MNTLLYCETVLFVGHLILWVCLYANLRSQQNIYPPSYNSKPTNLCVHEHVHSSKTTKFYIAHEILNDFIVVILVINNIKKIF